jgi:hypothetical protein
MGAGASVESIDKIKDIYELKKAEDGVSEEQLLSFMQTEIAKLDDTQKSNEITTNAPTNAPVGTSIESKQSKLTKLRTKDFSLPMHSHGKTKVRGLKVRRNQDTGEHVISEYTVETTLYSPDYEKVFTLEDNSDLVATDTQKNTVYVVLKRTDANTPEQLAIDIAEHFLNQYSILKGVSCHVSEIPW